MPGIFLVLYHCDSGKQSVDTYMYNRCMFMLIHVWEEEEYIYSIMCVFLLRKSEWKELRETPGNIHLYFFQFPVGLP